MNAKRKTPGVAGTGLFLAATSACLILSCASPEGFKGPFAAGTAPALPDGGADSKGSGSGGSVVGGGGTGGAAVVGLPPGTGGGAGTRGDGAEESGSIGAVAGQAGGGTGGGAARPHGPEATGSGGGSVTPTGGGGMAGAAAGSSGAAGGGSGGSAGGVTDGSATGGRGGRGGAAGAGAGGSPPATGPCAGLCTSPIVISLPHTATDLGSGATCQEAKGSIEGGNCGNFVSPRTFKVNGVTVPCTTADWTTIPPLRNDGYCFQASAGSHAYAYFVTF